MANLEIVFGALVPKLSKQLDGLPLTSDSIDVFQRDADAITRCTIRGLIPDSQAHAARRKLIKKIANGVMAGAAAE